MSYIHFNSLEMGRIPDDHDMNITVRFLKIVAVSINRMYNFVLENRNGIGQLTYP